jgi:hypothetical protein
VEQGWCVVIKTKMVRELTAAVYNKWHETELERWLSDHGMIYFAGLVATSINTPQISLTLVLPTAGT